MTKLYPTIAQRLAFALLVGTGRPALAGEVSAPEIIHALTAAPKTRGLSASEPSAADRDPASPHPFADRDRARANHPDLGDAAVHRCRGLFRFRFVRDHRAGEAAAQRDRGCAPQRRAEGHPRAAQRPRGCIWGPRVQSGTVGAPRRSGQALWWRTSISRRRTSPPPASASGSRRTRPTLTRRRIDAFRSPIWPRRKKPTPSDTGKRCEGGAAMPERQRRILRTFTVRSRPIAHGYDPLTARPIRGEPVLVRAANRQPRRQLPLSGKTGMFDFNTGNEIAPRSGVRARALQAIGTDGAPERVRTNFIRRGV
jgi:hypothetical protein